MLNRSQGVRGPQGTVPPALSFWLGWGAGTRAQRGSGVIRFTVDGSEPNGTSPLYVGPQALPETRATVVKARAFGAGSGVACPVSVFSFWIGLQPS